MGFIKNISPDFSVKTQSNFRHIFVVHRIMYFVVNHYLITIKSTPPKPKCLHSHASGETTNGRFSLVQTRCGWTWLWASSFSDVDMVPAPFSVPTQLGFQVYQSGWKYDVRRLPATDWLGGVNDCVTETTTRISPGICKNSQRRQSAFGVLLKMTTLKTTQRPDYMTTFQTLKLSW